MLANVSASKNLFDFITCVATNNFTAIEVKSAFALPCCAQLTNHQKTSNDMHMM